GAPLTPPPRSPSGAAPPTCAVPSSAAWVPSARAVYSPAATPRGAAAPHHAPVPLAVFLFGNDARGPRALRPACAPRRRASRRTVALLNVASALARAPNREYRLGRSLRTPHCRPAPEVVLLHASSVGEEVNEVAGFYNIEWPISEYRS